MERKPSPAFAEEEDPETGEAVLGTSSHASLFLSPEQSHERRKTWRRSASDFASDLQSIHLGSALDVIKQSGEGGSLLTLVAGDHEDNVEVWKECQNSGTKFRLFPLRDTVINGEDKTYIAREILLSREGGDLDIENPDLVIAQRTYASNGALSLQAHRLLFQGRLDVDRPYIFPKLGDEIPGVGCPDLHCTFRGIRDWGTVLKGANFTGWDRNLSVDVSVGDVERGRKILVDVERGEVVDEEVKPTVGVLISCRDFKFVFDGLDTSKEDPSKAYLTPPSKKRKMDDVKSSLGEVARTIGVKLIGMGPEIDNSENGVLRADLNINIVLKC